MNKNILLKYKHYSEFFDVKINENHIEIALIGFRPDMKDIDYMYDFASDIEMGYSILPFKDGDLSIIQYDHYFVVSYHNEDKIHWMKFDATQLISYISRKDIINKVLPFLEEDNSILVNGLFSDLIRTDYSYSNLNKKIKFLKLSAILSYIKEYITVGVKRILVDETVLGDVEVKNIVMAFRYFDQKLLNIVKIDSTIKIMKILEKNDVLMGINDFDEGINLLVCSDIKSDLKTIFRSTQKEFSYNIAKGKNYIFELASGTYDVILGNDCFKAKHLFGVYGGDERDLMIK